MPQVEPRPSNNDKHGYHPATRCMSPCWGNPSPQQQTAPESTTATSVGQFIFTALPQVGGDRTCWSICFNLWSRCACLSDTTDSKVKYNKIKGKQMQVHANPKCCTAEFRRGSGRSPVLSLDAINADRQVLRACSENW